MWDGIAVADLDLGAIFAARAEEGADDAVLFRRSSGCVVEDAEEGLWEDSHVEGRGGRCLGADGCGRERAGEVEIVGAHLRDVGGEVCRRSG